MKQIMVSPCQCELIAQSPPRLFFLSFPTPRRASLCKYSPCRFACLLVRERKLTGATPSLLTACTRTVETMPAQRTNLGCIEDDHTSFNERGQDDDLVGRGWFDRSVYNQPFEGGRVGFLIFLAKNYSCRAWP